MRPLPAFRLVGSSLVAALGLAAASGCGTSASMAPEAEPYAAAAVQDAEALGPYLRASGLEVTEVYLVPDVADARIEKAYIYDFGVEGRCRIDVYYTPEAAQQFGPRNQNERQRDLRGPIQTDLLRGRAPSGKPTAASVPTFTFERNVVACSRQGAVWKAFRSLEDYARDRS